MKLVEKSCWNCIIVHAWWGVSSILKIVQEVLSFFRRRIYCPHSFIFTYWLQCGLQEWSDQVYSFITLKYFLFFLIKLNYWLFLWFPYFGMGGCRNHSLLAKPWGETPPHYILLGDISLLNMESPRGQSCWLVKYSLLFGNGFWLRFNLLVCHLQFVYVFLLPRQFHRCLRLRGMYNRNILIGRT